MGCGERGPWLRVAMLCVRGLGEQTRVHQRMAQVEGVGTIGRRRTHHDRVEQPAPAHGDDRLAAQSPELRAQQLACMTMTMLWACCR